MILFYTLSLLCLVSCTLLVNARNPLYSLLCLVVFFICGSLQLLSLGVDFLAYVFIIVYVGALAVLFLFVVIMLDIKLSKLQNFKSEIPVVILVAFLCFLLLEYTYVDYEKVLNNSPFGIPPFYTYIEKGNLIFSYYFTSPFKIDAQFLYHFDTLTTLKALGHTLYTKYVIHFVLCGIILLVAIIGAIVLTAKGRYQSLVNKEKQFKQTQRFHSVGKYTN